MTILERKVRSLLARCKCLLSHGSAAWPLGKHGSKEPRQFIVRECYFRSSDLSIQCFTDVGVEVRHRCPKCGLWHSANISMWRDLPEFVALYLMGAIEYARTGQLPNKVLHGCYSPEMLWEGLQRNTNARLRALHERSDRKQLKKVR